MRGALLLAVLLMMGFVPDQKLADRKDEARAQQIIQQLRCFVCAGQPLNQSDVRLARDLRHLIRKKIAQGESNTQIFTFITARYGDDVLLNPPLSSNTFLLWAIPFFALFGGAVLLWRRFS